MTREHADDRPPSGACNTISGNATVTGTVVQAGDVHGRLHLS